MAEKWQQWMPLDINEFRGSPAVQAMHPTARSGYLYLLMTQWQTEDCALANDTIDLATESGLGDELWAIHGPRILRKFDVLPGGRLRNQVCFAKWEEARRIFESRREAANRTNKARSPHGHHGKPPQSPPRSADTRTGTGTGTGTGTEMQTGGPPFSLASELLKELRLATTPYNIRVVAEQIGYEAADRGGEFEAMEFIQARALEARARGDTVTVHWIGDRKYTKDEAFAKFTLGIEE